MKSAKSLLLLASSLVIPLTYASMPASWQQHPAAEIASPVMLDSVNARGTQFDPAQLLKLATTHQYIAPAVASTDTLLQLQKASGSSALMQAASTRLRSAAFAKGKLSVKCPVRHVVFVDGKEVGKSTEQGGHTSFSLTLLPERDYTLEVATLSMPEDTVRPTISLLWTDDDVKRKSTITADATLQRRMQLDDTALGNRVTGASLSADGKWALIAASDKVDAEQTINTLTLRNLATGAETALDPDGVYGWMPTSTMLYSIEKGQKDYDVFLINPSTLSRQKVASELPQKAITWAPSETLIYFVAPDKAKPQDGPLKRLESPASRIPGSTDRGFLMVHDVKSGVTRQLTYGGNPMICDVNPANDAVLFVDYREVPTQRPFEFYTLLELNPATMKLDTIVPQTGFLKTASYSPDGSRLIITGSADAFIGLGRSLEDGKKVNDYDAQAYILDRRTGVVDAISLDFDPSIDGAITWNKDGNIYMQVTEGFSSPVYSYNPRSRRYTKLPLGMTTLRSFSMGDAGSAIAYWGQSNNHAGSLRLYDVKKQKDTLIADPLADRLAELNFGKYEPWSFTASDGTTIDGYLCYPPDFDASKQYPLIVYYYGGTLPTQHGISNPYTPQLFASRDYMVYILNPSGTVGYGQEFASRHVGAWGKRTAEDIIEGTEQLCAEHPFINKEKIGCLGASYGGFMTQYLQTLTPMFAAAVSHAGISDVTSYWGEGYWGYSYNATAAADSYPWQNPDLFTKQGSLFNADKIHTPLLLLHGTADTNVPPGESIQIYNALKILGRPVEYVAVEGENHFIADYPKRVLWHNTIMAWFDRWLKDDPAWWDSMYPNN